jgi:hypothetical protein
VAAAAPPQTSVIPCQTNPGGNGGRAGINSLPPFGWNENSWAPQYQQYSGPNNSDWSNYYYNPPTYQQQGPWMNNLRFTGCFEDVTAVRKQPVQLLRGSLLFARRAEATAALSSSAASASSASFPCSAHSVYAGHSGRVSGAARGRTKRRSTQSSFI